MRVKAVITVFIQNLDRVPVKLQKPENQQFLQKHFSLLTLNLVNYVMVVWK